MRDIPVKTGSDSLATKHHLILAKALEIFAETNDYQRTTIDEIALRADIGKGTVYRYFRSKEELFLEILKQAAATRRKMILENVGFTEELRARLGRLVISLLRFTKKHPDYFKVLVMGVSSDNQKFLTQVNRLQKDYQETVCQILNEGVRQNKFREINPQIATIYICKLIDGALQIFEEEPNLSADQIVLSMLELLWNGLAK